MKKIFLIIFLFMNILMAQQRFMVNNGTTSGNIDTVVFARQFWGYQVINYGEPTDTIFFWTNLVNTQEYHKYPLLGGYSQYIPSSAPAQRLFIKGSRSGIKRLIVVFY